MVAQHVNLQRCCRAGEVCAVLVDGEASVTPECLHAVSVHAKIVALRRHNRPCTYMLLWRRLLRLRVYLLPLSTTEPLLPRCCLLELAARYQGVTAGTRGLQS